MGVLSRDKSTMRRCLWPWAKRQLEKRKIAYEALDNGFLSCAEPEKLQQICDSLGPEEHRPGIS